MVSVSQAGGVTTIEIDSDGDGIADASFNLAGAFPNGDFTVAPDGTLSFVPITAVDLTGTPGDDQLVGTYLDDTLSGLAGDDTLSGAAGADIIALGDDIGMQNSIMMSQDMYAEWLKPRLMRVIAAARAKKPDVIIQYHSCGHVTELIPELIDAGIDVLNPVQPECMEATEIFAEYGDRLAFNGSIGTQSTMPFATPQEVKDTVKRNLDAVGDAGGLLCCPTHMLEPEVPWANIEAYAEACREYK